MHYQAIIIHQNHVILFHRYLLNSNIWLQTIDGDDDKKNSDKKEKRMIATILWVI